jgi:hypothetical protein
VPAAGHAPKTDPGVVSTKAATAAMALIGVGVGAGIGVAVGHADPHESSRWFIGLGEWAHGGSN